MLRIDKGLSRNALARAAAVSTPTITRLEEGQLPSERVALAIASVFGMKPTDIWPEMVEDREETAA